MKATNMLRHIAELARHTGPMGQRSDAETLLKMIDSLSEESARIYLDRFLAKWRMEQQEIELHASPSTQVIRRRPMNQLEREVYLELATKIPKAANDQKELAAIEITIEPHERDSA